MSDLPPRCTHANVIEFPPRSAPEHYISFIAPYPRAAYRFCLIVRPRGTPCPCSARPTAYRTFRVLFSAPTGILHLSAPPQKTTGTLFVFLRFSAPPFSQHASCFKKTPTARERFFEGARGAALCSFAERSTRGETPYSASKRVSVTVARTLPDVRASMSAVISSARSSSVHQCERMSSPYSVSAFFAPALSRACSRRGRSA